MQQPDFLFGVMPSDVSYDIETYPNIFTMHAWDVNDESREWRFEISERRNDLQQLCHFMEVLRDQGCRMVGFNNIGFDYPVIHFIYQNRFGFLTHVDIYAKAMAIIKAPDNARFAHMVWESDWVVPQLDLYKIHHFDNQARATSLKVLEFNMRMDRIEDLPFDVGIALDHQQMNTLHDYNRDDNVATVKFYNHTRELIKSREDLSERFGQNFLNDNDTKIGEKYFIMRLEDASPGCCYRHVEGKRRVVQTQRNEIRVADVILPYVQFNHPEFQRILQWFRCQVMDPFNIKGVFKDISCTVHGFVYDFGAGGIHGSVESTVVSSDDCWVVEDWDVASYYPNLAIANKLAPAHLGETFCDVYADVFNQRKQYPKGSPENAMLKLALNGVYGKSNSLYSPFYDPQYTMSITINGQLLLCMLAEALVQDPNVSMVQINTDGLTVRYPRWMKEWVHSVARWWEGVTGLTLEDVEYRRMMIRDVNNYIAEKTDGSVKRKGAYESLQPWERQPLGWHQNMSALVVPKAAEAALVHGQDIREFITNHQDIYDFMLRAKVPRSSTLEWGGERVPNIVRYYVSTGGDILEKVMPPAGPEGAFKRKNGVPEFYYQEILAQVGDLWDERIHTKNQSRYEERRTGIHTGWTVKLCNNIHHFDGDINYEWYIREAEKLVTPLIT